MIHEVPGITPAVLEFAEDALAMLADAPVAAPVLAQPASPAPVGKARRADLGLSRHDLESVKAEVEGGCQVLELRYENDPAVGTRFDTLRRELGDGFIAVEFPGASTQRGLSTAS